MAGWILVFFVLAFIILVLLIRLTFSLLGLLVTIAVAAIVGWLADQIVPGRLPYGWLGAIVAGLLGSWLGGVLLGDFGPSIGGIAIVPALLGAVILAFGVSLVAKSRGGRRL